MTGKKSGKKGKPLTARQKVFLKNLVKGASHKDAYIAAGYKDKYAGQGAHQVLKQIQGKVPEIMDQMGLTAHHLIEKYLFPLLNAQETKFFVIKNKLVTRNVQALGVRLNALENAFKLRGSYARPDDLSSGFRGNVIIVDIPRPPKFIDVTGNGHKPEDED